MIYNYDNYLHDITWLITCQEHFVALTNYSNKYNKSPYSVVEYIRTLISKKEKEVNEDIVIFKYSPDKEESRILEIIYDDQIQPQRRFSLFLDFNINMLKSVRFCYIM